MKLEEKIAEELIDFAKSFENGDTLDTAEYVQRITSALSSLCVGVRLEWEHYAETVSTYETWHAVTPFGVATIVNGEEGARLIGLGPVKAFDTVDAAKADLASRISSCLNIRTEEEVRAGLADEWDELAAAYMATAVANDDPSPATTATMRASKAMYRRLRSLQQEGK